MISLPDGFGLTADGAAIALVIAVLLFSPFAPWLTDLRWAALAAAVLGAVLFLVAVMVVQVPAQAALTRAVEQAVSPFWLGANLWFLPMCLAAVAATLQEGGRLGALALSLRLRPAWSSPVALGAAVGAGVGLVEAAMVLGSAPPAALHLLSIAVLERVGAVASHVGAGAVLGAGFARRRVPAAFVLVVVFHAAVDGAAALSDVSLLSLALAEVVNLVLGLTLLTLGAVLARRPAAAARSARAHAV